MIQSKQKNVNAIKSLKPSVLIVDDYQPLLRALELAFEDSYQVLCSDNAEDGYSLAIKNAVDIIILDVDIGDDSGLDICKKLKENIATQDIPVVFFTAHCSNELQRYALAIGAKIVLPKKISLSELSNKLDFYLRTSSKLSTSMSIGE